MKRLGTLLAAVLAAAPAGAAVSVSTAALQVSISSREGRPVFHTVESLLLPPDVRAVPRLRAMLTLDNQGPRAETGIVIRFALSARVKPVGRPGEGTWTVPFLLDERHVPRVGRGAGVEVPLGFNRVAVGDQLNGLRAAGYWVDGLRFEAFIEPRRGESLDGHAVARTIPVEWKPAPAKAGP